MSVSVPGSGWDGGVGDVFSFPVQAKQEARIRRDDSTGVHREVTLNAMPGHLKHLVLHFS